MPNHEDSILLEENLEWVKWSTCLIRGRISRRTSENIWGVFAIGDQTSIASYFVLWRRYHVEQVVQYCTPAAVPYFVPHQRSKSCDFFSCSVMPDISAGPYRLLDVFIEESLASRGRLLSQFNTSCTNVYGTVLRTRPLLSTSLFFCGRSRLHRLLGHFHHFQ